jgi:hypothetical protein
MKIFVFYKERLFKNMTKASEAGSCFTSSFLLPDQGKIAG